MRRYPHLEEIEFQAHRLGIYDKLAGLVADREEAGELCGGEWIMETLVSMFRSEGLL